MIFLAHQRFFKHGFNIYFRVLANYTYELGAVTPVGDIREIKIHVYGIRHTANVS